MGRWRERRRTWLWCSGGKLVAVVDLKKLVGRRDCKGLTDDAMQEWMVRGSHQGLQ